MADTSTRRTLGVILALVTVVALVVVAARSADDATVADVLAVPEFGSVRADRLSNGTPVFVVHTPGTPATLEVVQAFTTEVQGPVTGLVAWCTDAGQFVDTHFGSLYDNRGRRLPATISGRGGADTAGRHTALDDLIHRQVRTVEGRTDPDDPMQIGGVQPLQPWQVEQRPMMETSVPPAQCRRAPNPAVPSDRPGPVPRLVDHSFLATPIDPDAEGWQITDGWIRVAADGGVAWCDTEPGPDCPGGDQSVQVAFDLDPGAVGPEAVVIGGPLAVRLDTDGQVARVAVMADSTWRGSSLQGAQTISGELVGSVAPGRSGIAVRRAVTTSTSTSPTSLPDDDPDDASSVDPTEPGESDGRSSDADSPVGGMVDALATECLPGYPRTSTIFRGDVDRAVAVPVTADTLVDVQGITDLSDLDQLDLGEGSPRMLTLSVDAPAVDVVVDAVTCTAVAVRDAR